MYEPLEWLEKNPGTNVKLKIFYFSLEISKEAKLRAAISHRLFTEYGIIISPQKLLSVFNKYILGENIIGIIKSPQFTSWLEWFESIVDIQDTIRNPFGIFTTVRNFAEQNGSYVYKDIDWINEDGSKTVKRVRDHYIPNDPDLFVLIIIDHISLLQTEKGQSLHQAITTFSSDYCLQMRDRWGFSPVVVQQQSAASSDSEFTKNSGKIILEKVKPNPEGLADAKYTARDLDLMMSLFDPSKYDISQYRGWDLDRLKGCHREFIINLNRNGISNAHCQLYFNGATSYFKELPDVPSESVYKSIENWETLTI